MQYCMRRFFEALQRQQGLRDPEYFDLLEEDRKVLTEWRSHLWRHKDLIENLPSENADEQGSDETDPEGVGSPL